MGLRIALLLAVVVCACSGSGDSTGTGTDGGGPAGWSNAEKCEHICAAYCGVRERCEGTPHEICRMGLDEADGGTCAQRAALFDEVTQAQVQACIAAVQDMTCAEFDRMFNTGEGIPAACDGILS